MAPETVCTTLTVLCLEKPKKTTPASLLFHFAIFKFVRGLMSSSRALLAVLQLVNVTEATQAAVGGRREAS